MGGPGRALVLVVLAVFAAPLLFSAPDDAYEIVDVSPSVVMARNTHGSNITCIALDDGLVFVDAGLTTEVAARFRKEMEERLARPTTTLLLTHGHLDHFFGMAAFSDVSVVAPEAAREVFEAQMAIEFTEERIEGYANVFAHFREAVKSARPFTPTRWFEGEIPIGAGGEIVFKTTGGHSAGDSQAHFAPEGVVVAGDLMQADRHPYFGDPATDLELWITTLKSWKETGAKKICPGHGPVVDADYLPGVWEFFEEMTLAVRKLKEEGAAVEEVVQHPSLPRGYWSDEPRPGWYDFCVAKLYKEL